MWMDTTNWPAVPEYWSTTGPSGFCGVWNVVMRQSTGPFPCPCCPNVRSVVVWFDRVWSGLVKASIPKSCRNQNQLLPVVIFSSWLVPLEQFTLLPDSSPWPDPTGPGFWNSILREAGSVTLPTFLLPVVPLIR